ncbi:MAG: 50S ribosomal protein L6 [Clostridia bacterium]|nr:50S ribosomal protein L6 [Clostridia bacterium]
MSRIGKMPVAVPAGVTVTYEDRLLTVKGPKGTLTQSVVGDVDFQIEPSVVHVVPTAETTDANAKHGLYRALLHNMVVGVTDGYTKSLTIAGVGWKAEQQGEKIVIRVGYSHPVYYTAPEGIKLSVPVQTEIVVSGIDKVLVGQVAAEIRKIRPPEPYHGYGISYKGERIERKEGKTGGKGKK